MKQKVIIIEEDQSVYEAEIEESEIPHLLDSGFISAVLRSVEEGIEYADVEQKPGIKTKLILNKTIWKIPHKKEE